MVIDTITIYMVELQVRFRAAINTRPTIMLKQPIAYAVSVSFIGTTIANVVAMFDFIQGHFSLVAFLT